MDENVRADLFRYQGDSSFKSFIKCFKMEAGFRYTYFHRMSVKYPKKSIKGIIGRVFCKRYKYKFGYQIPSSVDIGKGLMLKHWGYIVINSKTKIGQNCTILHGVTLGQTNRGKNQGAPKIGDDVYLSPGCVIVGNVAIGNNVLIAPNAYVNFDVPSNSIVIGNPGKITLNENATSGYIINRYSTLT